MSEAVLTRSRVVRLAIPVMLAQAAIAAGSLSREIAPIEVRGEPLADDEQPDTRVHS